MESLEDRRLLAVVAFDETVNGDLPATPASNTFLLDMAGTNTWQGTLETPTDPVDGFNVQLAPGVAVNDIRLSYTDVDPVTDPDSGVMATAAGLFDHTFSGTESVSAGGFSTLNPNLPITNATYANQVLSDIVLQAATAIPAGSWQIEIDTSIVLLPPSITTAANASVDENQTAVIDVDAVDENDSEGSGLTYSISGTDQAAFSIDSSTGVLQFNPAPNYEQPTDDGSDNIYDLTVTVTDSDLLVANQIVQVTVNDVNEPPVAEANGAYSIDAGQDLMVDASGTTDPDSGDTLSYGWDLDMDSTIDFTSATPMATIPWLTVIDHIGVGVHTVELTVTDSGGLTSTDTATVTISDHFVYSPASDSIDDAYTLVIDGTDLEVNDTATSTLLSRVPVATIATIGITGGTDRDALTIDYSGGFIDVPTAYDGGDPTAAPGDSLRLQGATAASVTHTFDNESSGSVLVDINGTQSNTITYTGLEPIVDNLSATDRVFTFNGGAETITISDDAAAADGANRIDSTLGESVDFASPTNSITINAGTGNDTINLQGLDTASAFTILNLNGDEAADIINVQALAAGMTANLSGGIGSDTFEIGTTNLDAILGSIVVAGDANAATPTTPASVTAKTNSPAVDIINGDQLNLRDSGSGAAHTYTLTDSTFARAGLSGTVTYATIETVLLETGTDADIINVSSTAASTNTTINALAGNNTVNVSSTGDSSLLSINTLGGLDAVNVTTTGASSIVLVDTGAGDDDVSVADTGASSGLQVATGDDIDVVTLQSTGASSAVLVTLGGAADVANVRATGTGSGTEIFGGAGSDTFNLSSDADGDRVDADGDPAGTLDGLLGDICVRGEDHDAGMPFTNMVTAKTTMVSQSIDRGDQINISDEGSAVARDVSLTDTMFTVTGLSGSLDYATVESVLIELGTAADTATINLTSTIYSSLQTGAGADVVNLDSTGASSITEVNTGAGNDAVTVTTTGASSVTSIVTDADDDDVTVTASGDSSGLSIDTGSGVDIATIVATGSSSALLVTLGDGADVANIRSTATGSATEIFGGGGSDTFNLSSDADGDRVDADGNPAGTLAGFLGAICIEGEAHDAGSPFSDTVTAKATMVSQSIDRGDQLNISDEGFAGGRTVSLTDTMFTATGLTGTLDYQTIESVLVETGSGDDTVNLNLTTPIYVDVQTNGGADIVNVDSTGDASILQVDSGAGTDTVAVDTTGMASVTRIVTADDDDDLLVTTTGSASGLAIDAGSGVDVLTILATGANSAISATLGLGADIANVRSTAGGSALDLFGGASNDTFNLSSDADGDRVDAVSDPSGNIDGLLGEICVFGENPVTSAGATETVDAKGVVVTESVNRGDQLNISDQGNGTGHTWTLTDTTVSRSGLANPITFATVESLVVETGTGADQVTVSTTAVGTRTNLTTGDGNDIVGITTTGMDSILDLNTGSGQDELTVTTTGASSVTLVNTSTEDDLVTIATTGASSGLRADSGTGADVVNLVSSGASSATELLLGDGADFANIQGTGAGSGTEVFGGNGTDRIDVSSSATGNLVTPFSMADGNLDGLAGELCVFGEDGMGGAQVESVTGRRTIGDTVSVMTGVQLGDELLIRDSSSPAANDYDVSSTTAQRVGTALITYETIESLTLDTGIGSADVDVASTAPASVFDLNTQNAVDDVAFASTGDASIATVTTRGGADLVSIASTGAGSISQIDTGAANDQFSMQSLGSDAGISVDTSTGNDDVNLLIEPVASMRTDTAVVEVLAGDGLDEFNVDEVYLNTIVDLQGQADNDLFTLTAEGSNPSGYLGRINNDPAGTDDAVAATRQLLIDGGANAAGASVVTQGVTSVANAPVEGTVPGIATGDRVIVDAATATDRLDLRYVLTDNAQGVLATTIPVPVGATRATTGNEVFETVGLESVDIGSGSADDILTVSGPFPSILIQQDSWSTLMEPVESTRSKSSEGRWPT